MRKRIKMIQDSRTTLGKLLTGCVVHLPAKEADSLVQIGCAVPAPIEAEKPAAPKRQPKSVTE